MKRQNNQIKIRPKYKNENTKAENPFIDGFLFN
jgi:hypothetical protein